MTHAELRERRSKIAVCIKDGLSINDAATQFDVSTSCVYSVMHEYNIPLPKRNNPSNINYPIIADIINTELSFSAIGKKHNITRQRVEQIATHMHKHGIIFAPRPHTKQPMIIVRKCAEVYDSICKIRKMMGAKS